MKVLLVGNYVHSGQQSMQRFSGLMRKLLEAAGHDVRVVRPPALVGNLKPAETGLGKWLGYIDRFILFRPQIRREADWADVVHICDQANAVYVPILKGKAHLVTCHDLLAIRSALGEVPANRVGWSGRIYQRMILNGLRQAQHVVCVSPHTRSELLSVAELPAARTRVVANALNYPFRPMPQEEAVDRLRRLGATEPWPFLLHVGGNQWYKNRGAVVSIFQHLSSLPAFKEYHLVMVGKPWTRKIRQQVRQSGVCDRVHEWTEVSNRELQALYSVAKALLFPSLQEGFGWPILEAQACGCPVFSSRRAPMTEVGGDAAIYFDPEDPEDAAEVIKKSLEGDGSRVEKGIANVQRFSADAMLSGYLSAYEKVIATNFVAKTHPASGRS
jgi:glycosyltransferase involved in cell wall biosynthesis